MTLIQQLLKSKSTIRIQSSSLIFLKVQLAGVQIIRFNKNMAQATNSLRTPANQPAFNSLTTTW